MTVSATNASSGPYTGNGSTTAFPFTFSAGSAAEVQVLVNGAIQSSGYSVALNVDANGKLTGGGTVTFSTAPVTGAIILPQSAPGFDQEVALVNNGAFLPAVIEGALDQAARRDIYLDARIDGIPEIQIAADLLASQTAAANAAVSAQAALGYQVAAQNSAVNSGASSTQAGLYAAAAQALAAGLLFDTAAEGVSQGIISLSLTAPGTGGTNGVYPIAASGGGGTGFDGSFTVAGGVVTALTLNKRGKNYTSNPTLTLTATGLSGATATAAKGNYAVSDGTYYLVKGTGNTFASLYKNVAGTATDQSLAIPSMAQIAADEAAALTAKNIALLGALPRGPVGIWPIDAYSASPNPMLPNILTNAPASAVKNRFPRRAFGSFNPFWNRSGCTVVDRAATAVNGKMEASVLTAAGDWKLTLDNAGPQTYPAGTYTIAGTLKQHSGGAQNIGFTTDFGTTRTSLGAVASSYGRITHTYTLGGATQAGLIGFCSADGVAGNSLELDNIEVFAGSSDLGPTQPDGNLYLGATAYTPQTYSNGELTTPIGALQFPSTVVAEKFTLSVLVKFSALASENWVFADAFNTANFAPAAESTVLSGLGTIVDALGLPVSAGAAGTRTVQSGGALTLVGKGYHSETWMYDGTQLSVWIDADRMYAWDTTLGARNLLDLLFSISTSTVSSTYTYGGFIGLWDRALSDNEVRNTHYLQKLRAQANGLTVNGERTSRIRIGEGMSIESNTMLNGGEWPWLYGPATAKPDLAVIYSHGGDTLANLEARLPTVLRIVPPDRNGRTFLMHVGIGTNDLPAVGTALNAWIARYEAYGLALQAAGIKLTVETLLPVFGSTAFNASRAVFNAHLLANFALYGAVAVINFAGDALMGYDTSFADHPTLWFNDGKHPSALGHARLLAIAQPVLEAI